MNATSKIMPLRKVTSDSAEVLYITECSPWGRLGYEAVEKSFHSVQPVYWSSGMPKPDLSGWRGDWIISFKADLILSRAILDQAGKAAINFHPSPPKYRGLGGYWWALHNSDKSYGVTAHHMDERIDHGAIIKSESFPILPCETVESLKERAAIHSLMLLNKTLGDIKSGKTLEPNGTKWEPHLYTNKELALAQSGQSAAKRAVKALEKIQGDITREAIELPATGYAAKARWALRS